MEKLAVLIDADNISASKLEEVLEKVSTMGKIAVKRAYGNWQKDHLKAWKETVIKLAINTNQQFDFVSGKNASDIALVIDAMDLMNKGIYETFVIVSSDSDYAPLAIRLREEGLNVIGVGESKTIDAFRNACDEFILIDEPKATKKKKSSKKAKADEAKAAAKIETSDEVSEEAKLPQNFHNVVKNVYDKYKSEGEFVDVALVGPNIKKAYPTFNLKTYGFKKYYELLASFPDKYEIVKKTAKKQTKIKFKCKA